MPDDGRGFRGEPLPEDAYTPVVKGALRRLRTAMDRDPGSIKTSEAATFTRKAFDAAVAAGDTRAASSAAAVLAKLDIAAGRDLEHLEDLALDAVTDLDAVFKLAAAKTAEPPQPEAATGDTHIHIHAPVTGKDKAELEAKRAQLERDAEGVT